MGGHGDGSSYRTNAAWVIGNAVKNDLEFQQWMIEDSQGVIPPNPAASPDSALALLLHILSTTTPPPREELTHLSSSEAIHVAHQGAKVDGMLRKALYALTSATRGNGELQRHLVAAGAMPVRS